MKFHLIGGFLGSGKTTAIIGAARLLIQQGKRVGIVTNDQGKYLVDTAFFRAADLPAVEVTGGCFCCNYDDLGARLTQLKDSAQPDVIFAESVGSCADIVATVIKPFLTLGTANLTIDTFSVFADARLVRRRLLGQPMPFGEDIVYIFDKQIEEANLLILNKADLFSAEQVAETAALAQAHFPDKVIRLQDSRQPEQIAAWMALLESGTLGPPRIGVEMDYARYGAGEAQLAWLDEEVTFDVPDGDARRVTIAFIRAVAGLLQRRTIPIGHVKFLIHGAAPNGHVKISLPTLSEPNWEDAVPSLDGRQVGIMVNARVETTAAALQDLICKATKQAETETGATAHEANRSAFHPAFPTPTHRMN
ncbi:MAG: GTP-binding protein [Anaerolineae bacterium]|nr:CobW-like GTP-binding protein [Thermoflexales bacterium]MDW8407030.1 GTP-binding protein [Anaerolineae bacterium]